jgi:hypothetical protein
MFCGSELGDAEDCVLWAADALCEGHDSPSLRILAGLLPPLNPFEVRDYATRALQELEVAIPVGSDAISAFARDLIADIVADGSRMQGHLARLCDLCIAQDYQRDIYDFYLLRWAYDDLQREPFQWYWDGADRSNIRDIVLERCRSWLHDYDTHPRANKAW